MAALLVRLMPLIHVLLQRHLVLRVSNIARAIKHKPKVQCWEKYFWKTASPGCSWVRFFYKKEMWLGSTHQAVQRGMFSGQWKEELGLTGNSSHLPSTPFFHPLVSLRELLAFVYVRGDKTQTRNGNGSERGWVCRAVLEVAGCDSSTCIWHLAIHRLFSLCSVWIPRGWFILTREAIAFLMPSIYSAKRERREGRSISSWYLGRFPFSFPLPAPSYIVETEIFLWETLHSWHNSMIFHPISSAFFTPSLSSHNSQTVWDYQYN